MDKPFEDFSIPNFLNDSVAKVDFGGVSANEEALRLLLKDKDAELLSFAKRTREQRKNIIKSRKLNETCEGPACGSFSDLLERIDMVVSAQGAISRISGADIPAQALAATAALAGCAKHRITPDLQKFLTVLKNEEVQDRAVQYFRSSDDKVKWTASDETTFSNRYLELIDRFSLFPLRIYSPFRKYSDDEKTNIIKSYLLCGGLRKTIEDLSKCLTEKVGTIVEPLVVEDIEFGLLRRLFKKIQCRMMKDNKKEWCSKIETDEEIVVQLSNILECLQDGRVGCVENIIKRKLSIKERDGLIGKRNKTESSRKGVSIFKDKSNRDNRRGLEQCEDKECEMVEESLFSDTFCDEFLDYL